MSSALSPGAQRIIGELVALLKEKEQEIEELQRKNDNRKVLSKSDVKRIRAWYRKGVFTQAELAVKFEVNPSTISRIVRGIYHSED